MKSYYLIAMLTVLGCGCATRNYDNLSGREVRPDRPPSVTSSLSKTFQRMPNSTMAVITLEPKPTRVLSDVGRAISDTLIQASLANGYKMATRDDVETLLAEIDFQRGSNLTASDAARLGKMLNVRDVLIARWEWEDQAFRGGRVSEWRYFGKPYPKVYHAVRAGIGLRMVNVETAEVIWVGRFDLEQDMKIRPTVSEVLRNGAASVAEKLPKTSSNTNR